MAKLIEKVLPLLRKNEQNSEFGVLVTGETGTGKSTLINSLVGRYVAEVVKCMGSDTSVMSKHTVNVEGVSIAFYDTPALSDSRGCTDELCFHHIKHVLDSGNINLVIYCVKMSESRLCSSTINLLQQHNKIGVKWDQTLIALTFADCVPVPGRIKREPGFAMAHFFNEQLVNMHDKLIKVLVEKVGVAPEVASRIKYNPTVIDPEEKLPNGEEWLPPFWLDILELLSPNTAVQLQEKHTINIQYINSKEIEGTSTFPHRAKLLAADCTPGWYELRLPHHSTRPHFTVSECHKLYQKAISNAPTITLHITKAMTIGPPRVGKTTLRHLLLELPLPEVSISTPVMKTAETVGILSSDKTASSGGIELSQTIKADSHLIQIGSEDKWVLVNESSGILNLLSYLRNSVEKATHDQMRRNALGQMQTQMKYTHSLQAPREVAKPQARLPLIHADSKQAGSQLEVGKQPILDTSTSATTEDSSDIFAVASELHQLLQKPNITNITLPDAELLQFLDCGGQLAFHDILPIFTTIPAIYLHVFDLARDLKTYPKDQLCLDKAEGEVYSQVQSPLTVAEMMTRSVMTVESLADKKVQLPEGVLLSEPPQSRIAFVGTHLDELNQTSENIKSTFDSTSKALQSVLQLESQTLEEMVMKNQDDRLPAMFFPVTSKESIDSDVGRRAIKQLKKRIRALVGDVKVKVPVKWYLYQMIVISHNKTKHTPVQEYGDLYKSCYHAKFVDDLKEFHTMVTYFHALGLLIHVCNDDAETHHEGSACLVFTDPSYLFENISKLFHVQFMEEIRCEGSLRKLKCQGRLTSRTLRDLKVDNTQLSYEAFMNVLIHFFIGAKVEEDSAGNEDCTLFIPSVLPVHNASLLVTTEGSCHFVIAFSRKPFVPCGVYAGVIARLQSLPQWTVSTSFISRSHACFGVATKDNVELFDYSSHIRVELRACTGQKAQEYRDTVLTAVAKSYCFLFHGQRTKDEPCKTCWNDPYLMLGLACHPCRETKTRHIATLQVVDGEARAVRCMATQVSRDLPVNHLELFQGIQDDAVVRIQHTRCTLSRKVMMTLPPQDTAGHTAATPCSVPDFLKKHETEFFEVVIPRLSLLRLVRKGVITEDVKSDISTSNTKDAREVLYHHLAHHANVDTLKEYCEVAIDADGYPKLQSFGRKMKEELQQEGKQTH